MGGEEELAVPKAQDVAHTCACAYAPDGVVRGQEELFREDEARYHRPSAQGAGVHHAAAADPAAPRAKPLGDACKEGDGLMRWRRVAEPCIVGGDAQAVARACVPHRGIVKHVIVPMCSGGETCACSA